MIRTLAVAAAIAVCGAAKAAAEPADFEALVRDVMALTGERDQYLGRMRAVSALVESGYVDFYQEFARDAPFADDAEREAFMAQMAARGAAFTERLMGELEPRFEPLALGAAVDIYREIYTAEEVQALGAFADSPAGRKFFALHAERRRNTADYVQGQAVWLLREVVPPALQAERERLSASLADDAADAPGTRAGR